MCDYMYQSTHLMKRSKTRQPCRLRKFSQLHESIIQGCSLGLRRGGACLRLILCKVRKSLRSGARHNEGKGTRHVASCDCRSSLGLLESR